MDFIGDFKCPQWVNFTDPKYNNYDSSTDAEISSCTVEDEMECEAVISEDEVSKSHCPDDSVSYSENAAGAASGSYCDESYQDSIEYSGSQAEEFPVHYPKQLSLPERRSRNAKANKTTVKPFDLNVSLKRKRQEESEEYVPLAEQVAAFQRKTPNRFHTTGPKAYEPTKHWSPHLVQPKSPNLKTAKRLRGAHVLSREEQEAKEVEEMKRYKFRAQPVKYDKLHNVTLPKVDRKLPTKPKSLKLRTAQRAVEVNSRKKVEEEHYEFHANPVPQIVLTGPKQEEKVSKPNTEPKTPNFALKKRAEKWNENKMEPPKPPKFKAMPAPAPTSNFVVKHEKKCTEIQPFSFEEKDKERFAKKQQKIHEEIEKENKVFLFKAQPMPSPSRCTLPAVPKKPLTHPEPFNLCSDSKSSKHSSFNSTYQDTSTFKARPATVLQKPPFIPEKLPKIPTEIAEFNLHTDVRAIERQKLKEVQDIKKQEEELLLQKYKEMQEEEERREMVKLRKETVHKANPVRHYKKFELKPSTERITEPISPKFKTDERLQRKHSLF